MSELPRKAVARTARLAALPFGYAGRTALGMGRRLGGASAEVVLTEVQQRTADQLFRTLGELKGGAMKLGQALSILESALPEEVAAPYRAQLTRLQDSAPPMPAATVHQVLAEKMGPQWRRQLVEIDPNPAASASIGQVHRGRWADGREVAVKVQYPGAGEALMSDFRQLGRLARTFGGVVPVSTSSRWSRRCRPGWPRSSTTGSRPTPRPASPRRSPTTRSSPCRAWSPAPTGCWSPSGCPARARWPG
jgi:predicted unusual protein kinase regulating ubiquinone biosynthesis (AarF/ABC1/UbiB family)